MLFKVTWTIEVEAEHAADAAREALKIQRDRASIAQHFEVQGDTGHYEVDLMKRPLAGQVKQVRS